MAFGTDMQLSYHDTLRTLFTEDKLNYTNFLQCTHAHARTHTHTHTHMYITTWNTAMLENLGVP